ncbi:MAG TPA: Xaa-Pro peptidase family protein [Actinomycetota bacterium]|nr:Xaa-Pro peptidase family protein [Actinomycetota bacterium]
MDYLGRIKHLQEDLLSLPQGDPGPVDAMYISNLPNVRYLCGFTGSNGALLVGPHAAWFLTDGRYRTQAADEVVGAEVEVYGLPDQLGDALRRIAGELGATRVGFEADHVAVGAAERLKDYFPGAELVPTSGLVEGLRRVKEPDELDRIRVAAQLADEGLVYILGQLRPGITERELAILLESHMRLEGAEAVSFPAIVAAAERSALPHAHPSERVVEHGRFLLFDLGCIVDGYCSDLTRTVVLGHADDRHREIYELVALAQQAGLDALQAGRTGAEVDKAARDVIAGAGYGETFGHGLGHGVGIEVHEAPTLRSSSSDVLQAGHVVTVEPGIYLPGWGGVRIEDLTVVTEGGQETLSRSPKELIVL